MATRNFRTIAFVLAAFSLVGASGCVSAGKYDAAVASAAKAEARERALGADLDDAKASLAAMGKGAESAKQALQSQLDQATAMNAELRAELEKAGKNVDELLRERGALSNAVADSKRRLDELRRLQAAAEARVGLYRELVQRFQRMIDAGDLSVSIREGRMVLALPNDVLFDSGKKDIKPAGRAALSAVASVLVPLEGRRIQVAGHTDSVPIATSRYPSNWELSMARAVEVVRFLLAQGLPPTMLSAAGYGEHDVVASNETREGRERNRRIEIILQPDLDELAIATRPEAR